jgi:signal transduction histidine kinase
MKLPPDGARWLVSLRWWACAIVFTVTFLAHNVLGVLVSPVPLYGVGLAMLGYNLLFARAVRHGDLNGSVERDIFWQILLDLIALTLLLYFSDLSRNPFVVYFVFHMIIAGIYLRGSIPYFFALFTTLVVGAVMAFEYLGWIPVFPLRFPGEPAGMGSPGALYLLGVFTALASSVWIAVYFTTSIRRYVDRAHAEIRQKEKMLGIGQLVAGIAHQIANPLDGVQNCLRIIGQRVSDDRQLNEYVRMMAEALDRIERTAKRVQAFARPRGIELQTFDVNAAVEATLQVLGPAPRRDVRIVTELADVPPVQGDPYTMQEVLFNLCTNALAAMPKGGTLTLRTIALGRKDEDQMGSVAAEVEDTGVGIPRLELEKIFEPFYTTRADSGGTGLGLGLCRMLISEMGGRITVRSVLGQGTTFTVVLNPAGGRAALRGVAKQA